MNDQYKRFNWAAAERDISRRGVSLHFQLDIDSNRFKALQSVEVAVASRSDPKSIWSPPAIVLEGNAPQQLMDDLWRAGIRPSAGSGANEAMVQHLADLRAIAFHALKMPGK